MGLDYSWEMSALARFSLGEVFGLVVWLSRRGFSSKNPEANSFKFLGCAVMTFALSGFCPFRRGQRPGHPY